MKIKPGYSYATIEANIASLVAGGYPQRLAIIESYNAARRSFFRKHSAGLLPEWLAFPKGNRQAYHYDGNGKPVKKNPSTRSGTSEVAKAKKLIESFSGHPARILGSVQLKNIPRHAIAIGPCLGVAYQTKRDGTIENYYHRFTLRKARPLLCVTPDGKRLLMIGGSYNFTDRGIMDRKS